MQSMDVITALCAEMSALCAPPHAPSPAVRLDGLSLPSGPAIQYAATIGLWQCLSHTWPSARVCWTQDTLVPQAAGIGWDALTAHLMECASRSDWTSPLRPTKHPLLANTGRRSLLRGVGEARDCLARGMSDTARRDELHWVLTGMASGSGQPPRARQSRASQSNWWNLGSLCPHTLAVEGAPYGYYASPWLAVLAWEALPWLDGDWTRRGTERPRLYDAEPSGPRRNDYPYVQRVDAAACQLVMPVPHDAIELRRLGVWFRGRGHHTGRTWSRVIWRDYHSHPSITWWTYGLHACVSDRTREWQSYGRAVRYLDAEHGSLAAYDNGYLTPRTPVRWITRYTIAPSPCPTSSTSPATAR